MCLFIRSKYLNQVDQKKKYLNQKFSYKQENFDLMFSHNVCLP